MNGDDEWQQKVNANAADARRPGVPPGCELTLVLLGIPFAPEDSFRSRECLMLEF